MAVNKYHHRVSINFTERQYKWLKKIAKKNKFSISKLVVWLISRTIANYIPKEDMEEMYKVLKVEWIKKPEWIDEESDPYWED